MLPDGEKCTGCFACINACPKQCISSVMDSEGFLQPVIDQNRCINCKKCEKACPIINKPVKTVEKSPVVYAAWSKDEELLNKSSSGGIFGVLAMYIIQNKGVVFGAVYNEDLSVSHVKAESLKELDKMHGSKYVQSNIGESFKHVKEYLEGNRYVLFTGTPCQIAGLYGFLGGDKFDNLITCDLVCHGVPSPGVFRSYINYLETKKSAKVTGIEMRSKKNGWMQGSGINLTFNKDKKIRIYPPTKDPYINGFMYSTFLRKSCYDCKFAETPRESDITIGDFWGIGDDTPFNHPIKQGVSLILINSEKGQWLFKQCNVNIRSEMRTLDEAKKGNSMLSQHQYINPYREQFFADYQTKSFKELILIYLKRRQNCKNFLKKGIAKVIGIKNIRKIKEMIAKI